MKTLTLKETGPEEAAAAATRFLIDGGSVVIPTDTSYGLAADASNQTAVEYIYALKGRDHDKPLSVVVADKKEAEQFVVLSHLARKCWAAFMPGKLTMVLPLKEGQTMVREVAPGTSSIGVRQPDYPFTALLAERFEKPYTATSANRSGRPPAYSVDEFLNTLPDDTQPHLVVDAGTLPIGPVSTVVRVDQTVEVLREGAIPAQQILDTLHWGHESQEP